MMQYQLFLELEVLEISNFAGPGLPTLWNDSPLYQTSYSTYLCWARVAHSMEWFSLISNLSFYLLVLSHGCLLYGMIKLNITHLTLLTCARRGLRTQWNDFPQSHIPHHKQARHICCTWNYYIILSLIIGSSI